MTTHNVARTLLKVPTLALATAVALAPFSSPARADDAIGFNRDIRPILSENCFACHGPDSAARKADLRLDKREAAVESSALVPGDLEASSLVQRITSADPEMMMPPPSSHKVLTAAQKDLLTRWVAAGAEYEPHWSLIAPVRPQPPVVRDAAWVRNPIDQFVLAKLELAGLAPAAEADRRTLARRLSLDLTGLPPAPAEVEAFVNDSSAEAYEKLVDRLLDSHHWGEHRARYWLDVARYADTHGIHFDNYREMWVYRDWVIAAFNRNVTFDTFTIEQLAGDLLPDRTLDQQVASGFNRCNITTNEGGAISEEYLVLYTRDRTETTSQVWLGMTAGCAVCHDHKFDPISQREFYELAAFFNNTTQIAMDGNIRDTPPVLPVPTMEDRPRWDALGSELPETKRLVDERRIAARADFESWLSTAAAPPADSGAAAPSPLASYAPSEGLRFLAPLNEGQGQQLALTVDGQPSAAAVAGTVAWDAGHVAAHALKLPPGAAVELPAAGDLELDQPFSYGAWVKFPAGNAGGAILARMDDGRDFRGWDLWVEGGRVGAHIVHKWPDDALKVVSTKPLDTAVWNHVLVTYDGSAKAAGVKVYVNGAVQETAPQADTLKNTIRTEVPLKLAQRHASSRIDDLLLQDVRIYSRALAPHEVEQLAKGARAAALAARPQSERSEAETNELFDWWLAALDAPYRELAGRLAALEQQRAQILARGTVAHVMQERGEGAEAFVLFRGEYDKRRDAVVPQTPAALPPMGAELPRNRLGFAQWLLAPEHPLTARVAVNRYWQEVFGTGLVRTAGDFGVAGELPSHPELLDWLAVGFRESGWDIKRFFKLLVTSATYRQAATATPEKLENDAANRLLSRGPRFRMDGEMVRDYALAASGLLAPRIGGPSVRPYQPEGVWEAVAMIGSNTRDYVRDSGEGLYRRSLYTFWKRSAPPAFLDIFNAPSRETCQVRRERTNTPLQALATMNDPQFVEAARQLAAVALAEGGDTVEGRAAVMFARLLGRPMQAAESAIVAQTAADLSAWYHDHPDDALALLKVGDSPSPAAMDPAALAAWTMLANQLMNLDEVLNK